MQEFLENPAALGDAMRHAEDALKPFHEFLRNRRADVHGPHYGIMRDIFAGMEDPGVKRLAESILDTQYFHAVSLHARIHAAYMPRLVQRDRKIRVSSKLPDFDHIAATQTIRVEQLEDEIDLQDIMHDVVSDALLGGLGACMIGTRQVSGALPTGEDVDFAEPFVHYIDPTSYLFDVTARDPRARRWQAFQIFESRSALRAAGVPDEALFDLETSSPTTSDLATPASPFGSSRFYGNMDDLVSMWFVKVKCDGYTAFGHVSAINNCRWIGDPLQWDGAEEGPITECKLMSLARMPWGVGISHQLHELHEATRMVWARVFDRGIKTKTIAIVPEPQRTDGERVRDSNHGEVITTQTGAAPSVVNFGSLEPGHVQLTSLCNEAANNSTANLQQTLGSKGISETAREAGILQNNADTVLSQLAEQARAFQASVLRQVCFYDYIGYQQLFPVRGTMHRFGRKLNVVQEPSGMSGEFASNWHQLVFDVIESRPRHIDPAIRAQQALQLVQSVGATIAGAQQVGLDPQRVLRYLADELDAPEIESWYGGQHPQQEALGRLASAHLQVGQSGQDVPNAEHVVAQLGARPRSVVNNQQPIEL